MYHNEFFFIFLFDSGLGDISILVITLFFPFLEAILLHMPFFTAVVAFSCDPGASFVSVVVVVVAAMLVFVAVFVVTIACLVAILAAVSARSLELLVSCY